MPDTSANVTGWGLIAGNGRFPFLVLEGARSQGIEMAVIALKEEASPELEKSAKRLHWVSLGELSKAIDLMHKEGVTQAVMAGQVKHNKIFSAIRPDWKLAKLLFSLPRKSTDALIGGIAKVLQDEGIQLVDSTLFLKPLLPEPGVLTRRAPNEQEAADIAYGHERRAANCGHGHRANGGDFGPSVRGRGSHGRNGRNHCTRGADCWRQGASGRESQQAAPGHALRCTRDWFADHRTDEELPRHGPGGGCGTHLAV